MLTPLPKSLFATLKCALFDQQPGGRFGARCVTKLAVSDYLEAFYDPEGATLR